jgi:hypothetical protein
MDIELEIRKLRNKSIDDPKRLDIFFARFKELDWEKDERGTLEKVFVAAREMVMYDVVYYYQKRRWKRNLSVCLRFTALGFGAAGALCPLSAPFFDEGSKVALLGYPILACAGSLLLANRVMSVTDGHYRFVQVQIALEQLIIEKTLEWEEFQSGRSSEKVGEKGFGIIKSMIKAWSQAVTNETKEWGEGTMKKIQELEKSISTKST